MRTPPPPLKGLLTEAELATQLQRSPRTMRRWRRAGLAPRHFKFGPHIYYDPADVEQWFGQRWSA